MAKEKIKTKNLSQNLKLLSEITRWFEDREEIDLEEGLKKIKESSEIIKTSRVQLKALENEFEEIKKEIVGEN